MDRLKLLKDSGAIKKGHFLLTSGMHSDTYFEKFRLIEHPWMLAEFIKDDITKLSGADFDVVIGPSFGGAFVAFTVGMLLSKRAFSLEKDKKRFFLGRGFSFHNVEKVLVCDDVLTTGSSLLKVVELVEKYANISAVYVLIDRRKDKQNDFKGYPLISGLSVEANVYEQKNCPLCKKGVPLITKEQERLY